MQHQQVKVIRKQLGPLKLALPIYSQPSLGQVSLLPLGVSEQRPSDHFRRTFGRILGWEVIFSDFMGLFHSRCHITVTACVLNQIRQVESTYRGPAIPVGPAVTCVTDQKVVMGCLG